MLSTTLPRKSKEVRATVVSNLPAPALAQDVQRGSGTIHLLWLKTFQRRSGTTQQYYARSSGWLLARPCATILAEGAMTLPVTLSGGVLFAS